MLRADRLSQSCRQPAVDLVVPNQVKESAAATLASFLAAPPHENRWPISSVPPQNAGGEPGRAGKSAVAFQEQCDAFRRAHHELTRAVLKIQDGCNGFCAYCIIPYARGASRSVAFDATVAAAAKLADDGFKEIVLTGIHLGDYGEDLLPQRSFAELLTTLDSTLPQGIRLRISSLEPNEVTPSFWMRSVPAARGAFVITSTFPYKAVPIRCLNACGAPTRLMNIELL